jgi:stage II sporulation protein D
MADALRSAITRRSFLAALAAARFAARAFPLERADVRGAVPSFTVLSLFHPQRLVLHADAGALDLRLDHLPLALVPSAKLIIDASSSGIRIADAHYHALKLASPTTFSVEVPGKLRREYRGTLTIDAAGGCLRCIVGIERELAVASIVAAESPPHSASDALAAQAVATRSFLLGTTAAHVGADFCDTTHCQFLREPPAADSAFTTAAQRTSGLVLQFRDPADERPTTLAAMYSRSCGGRTRTLAELGLPARGYPYYAVECAFCRAHPERWQRDLATSTPQGERARLDYNRIHGWSALPGHIDSVATTGVAGRGVGHGLGLCQLGAADMAARGASFADILAHYYPNTVLAQAS